MRHFCGGNRVFEKSCSISNQVAVYLGRGTLVSLGLNPTYIIIMLLYLLSLSSRELKVQIENTFKAVSKQVFREQCCVFIDGMDQMDTTVHINVTEWIPTKLPKVALQCCMFGF